MTEAEKKVKEVYPSARHAIGILSGCHLIHADKSPAPEDNTTLWLGEGRSVAEAWANAASRLPVSGSTRDEDTCKEHGFWECSACDFHVSPPAVVEKVDDPPKLEQKFALLMAKCEVLRQDFNHLYDLLVEAGVVPEDRA